MSLEAGAGGRWPVEVFLVRFLGVPPLETNDFCFQEREIGRADGWSMDAFRVDVLRRKKVFEFFQGKGRGGWRGEPCSDFGNQSREG